MYRKNNLSYWKPSGSNDYTSTYLKRADLIKNKETKCNCGCKDSKMKEEDAEHQPKFVTLVPKPREYYMVVEDAPPPQPRPRPKSTHQFYQKQAATVPSKIVVETTIEHPRPPTVYHFDSGYYDHYHRPSTSYVVSSNRPQYYTEEVCYPVRREYYHEPIEVARSHQNIYLL